jgi:hypothetical protein
VPPGPAEEASTWAPMRAWRRRRRRAARSPFGALRDASPVRKVSPAGATVTVRAGTAASDGCLPCRRPRARGGVAHPRAVKEAGSWCGTGAPQGCVRGNTAGVRHDRGKRGRWPPLLSRPRLREAACRRPAVAAAGPTHRKDTSRATPRASLLPYQKKIGTVPFSVSLESQFLERKKQSRKEMMFSTSNVFCSCVLMK